MSEKATANSGTPKAYRGAFLDRLDDEEKEIAELEAQQNGENVDESEDEDENVVNEAKTEEPESKEEQTWKKRYGDLRKHLNDKQAEAKKAQQELQERIEKLESSLKESPELPKTQEEVEEFRKQHPDVMAVFESVVGDKLSKQSDEVNNKLKKLEEQEQEKKFREAEQKLSKYVSDNWGASVSDLQASDEFHAWLMSKPQRTQDAIYEGGTDWESAADVIDLYFLKNGTAEQKKKARRKEQEKDAASDANPKGGGTEPKTKAKTLKESEVDRWSAEEFEKREAEVQEHISNGTFIYDKSGGAR